jgi:hypothetical protein
LTTRSPLKTTSIALVLALAATLTNPLVAYAQGSEVEVILGLPPYSLGGTAEEPVVARKINCSYRLGRMQNFANLRIEDLPEFRCFYMKTTRRTVADGGWINGTLYDMHFDCGEESSAVFTKNWLGGAISFYYWPNLRQAQNLGAMVDLNRPTPIFCSN